MRNLSGISLTKISQKLGTEPINIIGIEWVPGVPIYYADRTIDTIEGRILELSNLNSILRIDGTGASDSINIVLDDADGGLKQIYDTSDIHKRRVIVYQWFSGIPLSEKFVIFEGQINSPIVWSEHERTLSFAVSSKIEDREVGFSPEEGQFENLPVDLVGKPWPMAVGTARYIPAIPMQKQPVAILITPFGIPDAGLGDQIDRLMAQMIAGPDPPVLAHFKTNATTEEMNEVLQANAEVLAAYLEARAGHYLQVQEQLTQLRAIKLDQETWEWDKRKPIRVLMEHMTSGSYIVKMNNFVFRATFTADDSGKLGAGLGGPLGTMVPQIRTGYANTIYQMNLLYDINDRYYGTTRSEGFTFFNAGTQITILSATNIFHLVSCTPGEILGVYAYRSYDGYRKLALVPPSLYTITSDWMTAEPSEDSVYDHNPHMNNNPKHQWFRPIGITLKRPLSYTTFLENNSRVVMDDYVQNRAEEVFGDGAATAGLSNRPSQLQHNDEWEDEIYVSIDTGIGPNIVDIIEWLILNFSSYSIDYATFDEVKEQVQNYPGNFCLFEKRNLIELLNEIAMQARCSLWIKEYTFYIRYLSAEPTSVGTIGLEDIETGSLSLTSTETEDIVTKYIATWRVNYLPETEDNKLVVRSNIAKYGVQEESQNYFIYGAHYAVKKSATFWLIRKSNTWKKVSFICFLNKLNLEAMDCITVDLPVASEPVKGIIESAIYDSVNNNIQMIVWLPVRLGEMEAYDFAWPANIDSSKHYPTNRDIQVGASGNFIEFVPKSLPQYGRPDTQPSGHNTNNTNDEDRTIDSDTRPDDKGTLRPSDLADPLIEINYDDLPIINPISEPVWDYELRDTVFPDPPYIRFPSEGVHVFPGVILGGSGQYYTMNIYLRGLNEAPTQVGNVRQLQSDSGEGFPVDTWALVVRLKNPDYVAPEEGEDPEQPPYLYYMQVPVWLQ